MIPERPFSEACERNQLPIFEVIAPLLRSARSVLEIGSGTGQHAVYFAEKMQHLTWQTSDRAENHVAIGQWLDEYQLENIFRPLALDVMSDPWPEQKFDAIFSANTAHIMPWLAVEKFFIGVGKVLPADGLLMLYGPFNYRGQFTSESNAQFDRWLKSQAPHQGIRDFEALDQLAKAGGLSLLQDYIMPSNNRLIVWQKCLSEAT